METKPYNLQSPEQIAKDYGGNKQKIAEAMQMGILDPTAGTLAGMFIDRMRSAAQAEQVPQQTVAQQVFAPPAPPMGGIGAPSPMPVQGAPAGLGATPEAAQMAGQMPEMAAPEMPMPEMPAAEMPAPEMAMPEMPTEEAPMGMKGGGKVRGHFNASDKGSNYGANISLDDLTSFSLEGSGRRVFDPDVIRAALRHRKGDTEFNAEHTLRGGSDYGIERPFLGGRLGIHAGASRGFIPDSVRASYNRSFADGGMVPPYASGGGLSQVPIPAGMFDEPNNGGYANGGIVAFARGGNALTDEEAWGRIKRLEGGLGPRGEMRVSSAGAVGPSQLMPATAPEAARLAGLPWDEERYRTDAAYNEALGKAYYLSRVSARGGDYNKAALDYHSGMGNVDKGKIGPAGRDYLRKFGGAEVPERNTSTAQGFTSSLGDISDLIERRFAKSDEEKAADEALNARAKELASPEYEAKERRDSMWETLASIGFNMASSKSPYLLQAVGEAAAAALPGAIADKKERKQLKDKALNLMVANGAKNRKDAMEKLSLALQIQQAQLGQQQFGQKLSLDQAKLLQDKNLQTRQLDIEEYKSRHPNMSDLESGVNYFLEENPKLTRTQALEAYLKLKQIYAPAATTTGLNADQIKAMQEGRGGAAPQVINVGTMQ
jgi:hypothetical protein